MTVSKFIEVKSANTNGIFKVLANKGVCWQVEDPEGGAFLVQKKQVVRGPWEEDDTDAELLAEAKELSANHSPSLASALAQVAQGAESPKKKDPAPKAERDADLVTLKELCFTLNVIPRIARRRLRKASTPVGTGARWEWKKGSPELAKVTEILQAKTAPDATEEK